MSTRLRLDTLFKALSAYGTCSRPPRRGTPQIAAPSSAAPSAPGEPLVPEDLPITGAGHAQLLNALHRNPQIPQEADRRREEALVR
jgi:hypothetical protein